MGNVDNRHTQYSVVHLLNSSSTIGATIILARMRAQEKRKKKEADGDDDECHKFTACRG